MGKECEIIQTPIDEKLFEEILRLVANRGCGFVIRPEIDQLRRWAEEGRSWVAINQGGEIKAHVALDECGRESRMWELRTCVAENGWGKRLVKSAEEQLEGNYPIGMVLAVVRKTNEKGKEFFPECGYERIKFGVAKPLVRERYFAGRELRKRWLFARSWGRDDFNFAKV